MERLSNLLGIIEKIVIILVAIAALFPMYQWIAETDMRVLQRTTEVIKAVEYCEEFREQSSQGNMNLAEIDFKEEVCSVIYSQLNSWYQDVFDS
ncbi:hypothetical protein RA27_14515 [Ruegeria sp. ANG-R]|nr:hypothetical protein RA27_14515 [Ruegeria sp. ANG-R]